MIEANIPIPPISRNGGRKPRYPLDELRIGDSIFGVVRPATDFWQKKLGYKYLVRATIEDGQKGWRIWRTG